MKKQLLFLLLFIIQSYLPAQVTHEVILSQKYSELPFGVRTENSGNYSVASFDVAGDQVLFTTFNDLKKYQYNSKSNQLVSTLKRNNLDFASDQSMPNMKSLSQRVEEQLNLLSKKIFYGKPETLTDEGGILSGQDGEVMRVKIKNDAQLLIETEIPGIENIITLNFPSNLAYANLIGVDANGNLFLLVETYVTQIPLVVTREVYSVSKNGIILSILELPSTKFIYTLKDLQIDAVGNLYHLYSDEIGIKIFRWKGLQNSSLEKSYYPAELIKPIHFNNYKTVEEPQQALAVGVNTPASRTTALKIGESYALHQYTCASKNLSPQNVAGSDGDSVRTPSWLVVGSNARVAYKWGGFNTLAQYDAGLANGLYAADINTSGVSSYAVGVDCSGFVSRCWQMSYHSSTSMMPGITTQYPSWDNLKPGDAIHKIGHVRLFVNRTLNGGFRVVESAARGWDVSYWTYAPSDLTTYTPRYYNNMEANANLSQPDLLQAIFLSEGTVSLKWNCDTTNVIGYRIYASDDGKTWSLLMNESSCNTTWTNIFNLNHVSYYRVASVKKNGAEVTESNWSNAMGINKSDSKKCLIVDGFKRSEGSWRGAGHTFAAKYGKALLLSSHNFETVSNTKVLDSTVILNDYDMVFWISGDESTIDETFSSAEQKLIKNYLEAGGNLFVSGSEIGWDLSSKGDTADKDFYKNYFKSLFISDDAGAISVKGLQNSALNGCEFYFGQTYEEDYPDEVSPLNGSTQCLQYANGKGAGNQYAGTFGTSTKIGKLIYLAFPLETVSNDSSFNKVISQSIEFFTSSISAAIEENVNPTKFSLVQNYPNPFNPITTISYNIASEGFVTLKIFDVLGNEVATLVNEAQHEGKYEVIFSSERSHNPTGKDLLSSGIYFYQLHIGDFVETRKMVLTK